MIRERIYQYMGMTELMYVAPECPIQELLLKNSKGQFLTRDEKNRVVMYNQEQRKKRSNKN